MAVTLPIGFNFRQAEAFVTDVAPSVWARGAVHPYSASPGWGFTSDSAVQQDNRDSGIDARLAGIIYVANNADPANAEFRVDTGAGTFDLRLALGDGGDINGPHEVKFYDGANTTPILTVAVAATAVDQWYDASGTLRTSAAAWVSNNVAAQVTLSNAYLRMRVGEGDGSGSTLTTVSHLFIEAAPTYTYSRPESDITEQWSLSTGTDSFALIDETTASDTDYIYATAAGQTTEVRLQAMSTPTAGTDVLINYRVQGISGGGRVTVSLYCNTTLIKSDTLRTANGDYTMTVTSTEWDTEVTDWSNMRLRFVSS